MPKAKEPSPAITPATKPLRPTKSYGDPPQGDPNVNPQATPEIPKPKPPVGRATRNSQRSVQEATLHYVPFLFANDSNQYLEVYSAVVPHPVFLENARTLRNLIFEETVKAASNRSIRRDSLELYRVRAVFS